MERSSRCITALNMISIRVLPGSQVAPVVEYEGSELMKTSVEVAMEKHPAQSWAMRMAGRLGRERLAWSLRRLHCPVGPQALVLEVGSGGNPYYRANVLLDAYESTGERHWVPLVADRPTVLGFVENLPFQDKAFDFVIASHVLEHSRDPEKFLTELQRVSRAGYIEVPDAFMERINPYPDHRLEITMRQGCLVIRKKENWLVDPELVELYEDRAKAITTGKMIPGHPFAFHVRYYWSGTIDFQVLNPEAGTLVDESRPPEGAPHKPGLKDKVHARLRTLARKLFSQHERNAQIDVVSLLRCTRCNQGELESGEGLLVCRECGTRYPVRNGVPDMTGMK